SRYRDNTFYPCDLEWNGVKVYNAGCRSRGSGSRNGTKPGLLVDFDHYVDGQRFLGLHSLVLDNCWQDASMIRERLSMLVFNQMGIPAPRVSHTRLHVGPSRDYAGVYALVENVNTDFLARHFEEAGGYLYEFKWIDPGYHFDDLGDDLEPYAERFEPRTHETASIYTLFAPIRDMVQTVNRA